MAVSRPTYTATFRRADTGTWVAQVVEEPNVQGFGGTLVEARRNVRDAISTLFGPFGDEQGGFDLVEDVQLPEAVLAVVDDARRQRTRSHRQREEARAAADRAAARTQRALIVTRQAAHLLLEHGGFMKARADDGRLVDDVRLPDEILLAVERSYAERQAADEQRRAAQAAREAATAVSSEAVVVNREAARLLIDQCGLTMAEAAGILGLSPQRAQQLLGS